MNGGGPARHRLEVLSGAEELARRAAEVVVATLDEAIRERGRATWVLSGGSTPDRLYRLLAARPRALDWRRVELFWGDERCVAADSPASNFALVRETLLARLPLAGRRVHRIEGELPPAEAARRYDRRLEAALARGPFDLVQLGLGADGHVASLFPGAPPPLDRLAAAVEAPVEPRLRVTLTPPALSRTRLLLYLVAGAGKAAAMARAVRGEARQGQMSAQVRPETGETLWLVDREAAAGLAGEAPAVEPPESTL